MNSYNPSRLGPSSEISMFRSFLQQRDIEVHCTYNACFIEKDELVRIKYADFCFEL